MVMEMRMSDWTDFVGGNISVFQSSGAKRLFWLLLYEVEFGQFSIQMFIIVNVNQSKRFEFLIKI